MTSARGSNQLTGAARPPYLVGDYNQEAAVSAPFSSQGSSPFPHVQVGGGSPRNTFYLNDLPTSPSNTTALNPDIGTDNDNESVDSRGSASTSGKSDKPRPPDLRKAIKWVLKKLDINYKGSFKISAGIFFFKWLILILKAFASAGNTFFNIKILNDKYLRESLFDLPYVVPQNLTACEIAQGEVNKHPFGEDPKIDSYLYFRLFTAWMGFCFSIVTILLTRYSPVHSQTEILFGKREEELAKEDREAKDVKSVVYIGRFIFSFTIVSALFSSNASFLGSETITRNLEELYNRPYDRMLEIGMGFLGAIPALFVFFAFKIRGGSRNGKKMVKKLNAYYERIKKNFLEDNVQFRDHASGVEYRIRLAFAFVRGIRRITVSGISLSVFMTLGSLLLADLSTTHALQRQACLFDNYVLSDEKARCISGSSLIFAGVTCFSTNGLETIKWVDEKRSVRRALKDLRSSDYWKAMKVMGIMGIFAGDAFFVLLGVGTGSYSRLEYWELTGVPAFILSVIFASAFILGSYCFAYLPTLRKWIGDSAYNHSKIEEEISELDLETASARSVEGQEYASGASSPISSDDDDILRSPRGGSPAPGNAEIELLPMSSQLQRGFWSSTLNAWVRPPGELSESFLNPEERIKLM
jgi:hypothetical protein